MTTDWSKTPNGFRLKGIGTNEEGETIQIDFGTVSNLILKTAYDTAYVSPSNFTSPLLQANKNLTVTFDTSGVNYEIIKEKGEDKEEMGTFIAATFPDKNGEYKDSAKVYYYEIDDSISIEAGNLILVKKNDRRDLDSSGTYCIVRSQTENPYGNSNILIKKVFKNVNYKKMPLELEPIAALGSWVKILEADVYKNVILNATHTPTNLYWDFTDTNVSGLKLASDNAGSIYNTICTSANTVKSYENKTSCDNIKEEKNMNMKKLMGDFVFGKYEGTSVQYSFNGIAFKSNDGTYNVYNADGTLTNVSDMVMDIPVFAMPVSKSQLQVGDVILHPTDRTPLVVKENANTAIIAVEPKSNEIKTLAPKKSIFGFDFYTKIMTPFDMFGGANANAENPFGNMLPFLMMGDNNNNDMSTMLMFSMMNGGNMDMNSMLPFMLLNDKSSDNNNLLMAMIMSKGFNAPKEG